MCKFLGNFENATARPLLNAVPLFLLISAAFFLFVPQAAHAQIWASSGFTTSPDGTQEIATCSTSAVNPATGKPTAAAADYNLFYASCSVTPSAGAVITSPQCPSGPRTSNGAPSGNPTGQCSITFQPQPGVTYTLNSIHAVRFILAPVGTACGPPGFNVPGFYVYCLSDPLGYYSMNPNAIPPASNWPAWPAYPGTSASNTNNVTCAARGGICTAQNIPHQYCLSGFYGFGVPQCTDGILAPPQWDLATTSAVWTPKCADVVNGSVPKPNPAGASAIEATFIPNFGFTIAQAAQVCGFKDFDWVQIITQIPDPGNMWARNTDGAFELLVIGPVRLTSADSGRVSDPPQGGGYDNPNPLLAGPVDNSYPFYCNVNGDPACVETANTLSFGDQPRDSCLVDAAGNPSAAYLARPEVKANCQNMTAPVGSHIGFMTHLAGVTYPNGAGADPAPVDLGIGFHWSTNFNGSAGGVIDVSKSMPMPVDPGSGSGGITVSNINETTNYQYPRGLGAAPTATLLTQISTTVSADHTVTITNNNDTTITGPFQIVLDSPTFLCYGLANATGSFGGEPYITVPGVDSLDPGQSATVALKLSVGPCAVLRFTPLVYSGSFE